jgi:hypothetical protein
LNAAAVCFSGGQTGPPCTAPEDICTAISQRAILSAASFARPSPKRSAYASSEVMM